MVGKTQEIHRQEGEIAKVWIFGQAPNEDPGVFRLQSYIASKNNLETGEEETLESYAPLGRFTGKLPEIPASVIFEAFSGTEEGQANAIVLGTERYDAIKHQETLRAARRQVANLDRLLRKTSASLSEPDSLTRQMAEIKASVEGLRIFSMERKVPEDTESMRYMFIECAHAQPAECLRSAISMLCSRKYGETAVSLQAFCKKVPVSHTSVSKEQEHGGPSRVPDWEIPAVRQGK